MISENDIEKNGYCVYSVSIVRALYAVLVQCLTKYYWLCLYLIDIFLGPVARQPKTGLVLLAHDIVVVAIRCCSSSMCTQLVAQLCFCNGTIRCGIVRGVVVARPKGYPVVGKDLSGLVRGVYR